MDSDYDSDNVEQEIYDNENNFIENFDPIDGRIIECIVKMKMFSRDRNYKMFSSRNTFELVKQFYVINNIQK